MGIVEIQVGGVVLVVLQVPRVVSTAHFQVLVVVVQVVVDVLYVYTLLAQHDDEPVLLRGQDLFEVLFLDRLGALQEDIVHVLTVVEMHFLLWLVDDRHVVFEHLDLVWHHLSLVLRQLVLDTLHQNNRVVFLVVLEYEHTHFVLHSEVILFA